MVNYFESRLGESYMLSRRAASLAVIGVIVAGTLIAESKK